MFTYLNMRFAFFVSIHYSNTYANLSYMHTCIRISKNQLFIYCGTRRNTQRSIVLFVAHDNEIPNGICRHANRHADYSIDPTCVCAVWCVREDDAGEKGNSG